MKAIVVAAAAVCPLMASAVENGRILTFSGQPAMAAGAMGTVSNADGSMTVTPAGPGSIDAYRSYQTWTASTPGQYSSTTYVVTPSAVTVPYRLAVADLRVPSTVWISAKCLDPSTLAIEPCNLGDISMFPRTHYPASAGYIGTASVAWDSTAQTLKVNTPSIGGSPDTQSNGLYIDLPPYVREITYRASNSSRTADYIAGAVYVADAPSVSKTMSPADVKPGQRSALTITLKNPDLGGTVPGVSLTDDLPGPLELVSATHN